MQYEEFKQAVESGQLTPQNQQHYDQYKSLWVEMAIKGDCLGLVAMIWIPNTIAPWLMLILTMMKR